MSVWRVKTVQVALRAGVAVLAVGAWAPAAAQGVIPLEAPGQSVPEQSAPEQSAIGNPATGNPVAGKPRPTLRSPGKPVAPFMIEHRLSGPARAGMQLDVELVLRPQTSVNDVTVRLTPGEGLWIEPEQLTLDAAGASPDAPVQWRIRVLPLDRGAHNLSVYAEAAVDGARQGRSVVIAIPVGGDATPGGGPIDGAGGPAGGPTGEATGGSTGEQAGEPAGADAVPSDPGAERVIRMPAQERRGSPRGAP